MHFQLLFCFRLFIFDQVSVDTFYCYTNLLLRKSQEPVLTHNHGSQKTKEPIQEPTLNCFFVANSFMKPARFFEKFLKKIWNRRLFIYSKFKKSQRSFYLDVFLKPRNTTGFALLCEGYVYHDRD
jgi:hypothetical protein